MLKYKVPTRHRPKVTFAKALRKDQTPGEKALWKSIRAKRFHGLKFRRQVPVGPFIADFLCVEKMLIIEVDGNSHFLPGAKERDAYREAYLRRKGFTVFRCLNGDAVHAVDGVLERLRLVLGISCD